MGWAPAFAGALALLTTSALAETDLPPPRYADTQLADPRKEAEAKALMETLRCLVCQGQSIADSNADLAGDMRALVRERIAAGQSPDQVRAYLVRRYGDWVSFQPPFDASMWLLWVAPALVLIVGGGIALGSFRRWRR